MPRFLSILGYFISVRLSDAHRDCSKITLDLKCMKLHKVDQFIKLKLLIKIQLKIRGTNKL